MKPSLILNNLLKILSFSTLCLMTILVFCNVILRYFFHSGIPWSEELARICFVYAIFIGIIIAARSHSHLIVDFITSRLSLKTQKWASLIANLLSIFILLIIVDGAWDLMQLTKDLKMPATELSTSWLYLAAFISSIAYIIILVIDSYNDLRNK
ncbi:TRAP transporter small permease [Klebsiella grimontii]|uniref:TRAP transporter small permease n=2 Tax=Klebsiella grimontii TaxID=2058152 RepID=UPI0007CCB3C9|nr:TRAP transporter small permease [Klebsiella grimontii]MBS6569046.1 TRAP transporter small permease [Klebsiella michiganensis]MBZ7137656.1 TRAP transporter small permease [Klebsiella grimontii]MDU4228439.1 TRAP transporter small permease [Klebsiella grimontii]MDU4310840.1 TRAP transporter small permease [Klebsiella michiganensis]TYG27464.1 TRAP transporter small permease [Klebsiella grimontii]